MLALTQSDWSVCRKRPTRHTRHTHGHLRQHDTASWSPVDLTNYRTPSEPYWPCNAASQLIAIFYVPTAR